MRKTLLALMLSGFMLGGTVAAQAAESTVCTKDRGTVTCTTTTSPGNNQGGVGSTTTDQTKGNTTNKSPEPQNLADNECTSQNPPKSQGSFSCP